MCNDSKNNNNSLFIMGLIIGAIIASAVVLISAEDKAKIIKKIKNKFNDFFGETDKLIDNSRDAPRGVSTKSKKIIKKKRRDVARYVSTNIVEPIKKISVTIPSDVETLNLTPKKVIKSKKVFKRLKT